MNTFAEKNDRGRWDNCYVFKLGKDHSHVAYRMKCVNLTFEDNSGKRM